MKTKENDIKRFWSKVDKKSSKSCWIWTAWTNEKGYPTVYMNGKTVRANRVSYELSKGKIGMGLVVDHLCRVRKCVNPDHLRIITNKENILIGFSPSAINARKTHCIRGHPLLGKNLIICKKRKHHNKGRKCKMCRDDWNRKRYLKI